MRVVSTTACDDQVMNDLSSAVSSHRWRCVAVKGSCHQTGGKPTNQAFSMPAAGGAIATGQSHGSYCVGEVGGKVIRTNVQDQGCVASEITRSEMYVRAGR